MAKGKCPVYRMFAWTNEERSCNASGRHDLGGAHIYSPQMSDLERESRERYLDTLATGRWDEEDPRLDYGVRALPYFIAAFERQTNPELRAKLIRVIWQFRDASAFPTLAIALTDSSEEVWKDALDGIETIGGPQAVVILKQAWAAIGNNATEANKRAWVDEALIQVVQGHYDND